jgi:hypothetical protein
MQMSTRLFHAARAHAMGLGVLAAARGKALSPPPATTWFDASVAAPAGW